MSGQTQPRDFSSAVQAGQLMTAPYLSNISAAFNHEGIKSVTQRPAGWGYGQHYSKLASDRYYFKVDDDIMYIQPGAVDAMLFAKLQNRFWVVSANVINHSSKIAGALDLDQLP